jgi:ABC-type Fe3+ transport system permease subunit
MNATRRGGTARKSSGRRRARKEKAKGLNVVVVAVAVAVAAALMVLVGLAVFHSDSEVRHHAGELVKTLVETVMCAGAAAGKQNGP